MKKSRNRGPDSEPILQTAAEPLQQILKKAAGLNEPTATIVEQPPSKKSDTPTFCPVNRQPLATLKVLDDGSQDEGEVIRIRQVNFTIGRERGDFTIPFDQDISGQHLELRCQQHKGKFRWYLIDSDSTNGTFVRAYRASLSRDTELVLGSRRYLFQVPEESNEESATEITQTKAYSAASIGAAHPRLLEVGSHSDSPLEFQLSGDEFVMGRNKKCSLSIPDDRFLSPRHAKFYQDDGGRWMVSDLKSHNGVWLRVRKMPIDQQAEFQIGQQRFSFSPRID